MFGSVGSSELLLVAVLALLLFGPRKLPQIGKSLGKALAEFRGAAHEFKSGLEREVELEQVQEARASVAAAGSELRDAARDLTSLGVARGTVAEQATPPEGAGRAAEGNGDTGGEPDSRT